MQIVYKANDGKLFETKKDCIVYEYFQKYHFLNDIIFLDKDNNPIDTNVFTFITYDNFNSIIIPYYVKDKIVQKVFSNIERDTGFELYKNITSSGKWNIVYDNNGFKIGLEKEEW